MYNVYMTVKKILIIEDEANISRLLKYNLDKNGYLTNIRENGEDALEYVKENEVDLITLDLMLPGINGLEVCKKLRSSEKTKNIPIIMLTAKGEEIDRIMGLEYGADDYMVKPFSPRELVLRIEAILRRSTGNTVKSNIMINGSLTVNIDKHLVSVNNEKIDLTKLEFDLLVTLLERKGRVQTRETLLNTVWDIAADVTTRTVDTHIKRLRQKLGSGGDYIKTIRGYGYKIKDTA